jgi:plasmid stabilization system protein ParE
MSEYVLSDEARQEFKEIWDFIARDDVDAADRWIIKLLEAMDFLARNPRAGHTRKDLTDHSVLFWPVGEYLIIYRIQQDYILILAVTQGGRNIPSYLRHRT